MGFQASCKQAFLAKPEVENRRTVTESKVELIVKEPTNFSSVFQQSVQHNFPRHVASIHFEFESSTFINCWLQHRVPTITSREIVRKKKYSSFYFLNPCSPKTATWSIFHPLFKGPNRRNLKAGVEVDVVPNGSVVNYKHRHFITCTDTSFQTCSMLSMHEDKSILTDDTENRPVTLWRRWLWGQSGQNGRKLVPCSSNISRNVKQFSLCAEMCTYFTAVCSCISQVHSNANVHSYTDAQTAGVGCKHHNGLSPKSRFHLYLVQL